MNRLLTAATLTCATSAAALAATPTDTYWNTTIADPYRWLENPATPQVKAWTAQQTAHTRTTLDAIPQRPAIAQHLKTLIGGTSISFSGLSAHANKLFALCTNPAKQQPYIVILDNADHPETARPILDPNTIDPTGHTEIDWWAVSPDGKTLAASLSHNGSETGDLHIFSVATSKETEPPIPRVQYTAGGSLAWSADSQNFWYTRFPGNEVAEPEQHFNVQASYHHLNTDDQTDPLALAKNDGLERISEIFLANENAQPAIIATVARGDGGQFAFYLLKPNAPAVKLADYPDNIVAATMAPDGTILAISHAGAPNGKIIRATPPFAPGALAHAPTIIPQSQQAIRADGTLNNIPNIAYANNKLYVRYMDGGPTEIHEFPPTGGPGKKLPLPPLADIDEMDTMPDGSILFRISTYLQPAYFVKRDPTGKISPAPLAETSAATFTDAQTTRTFATSKDGTKIPLTIISRKTQPKTGQTPTLLYGYGGYSISLTPEFGGARLRTWLDAGGIWAIANTRGGSEYGEAWHQAGALTHKQNVFDDFTAAATYLIENHITDRQHLALMGESNGGLLMGAMITQHPDLAHAVVARVGIYDMLRVERDPNGAFNTTEFGTVKNKAQFEALYAYSPYHHVRKAPYPAALFTTGETDPRVNPAHSRKFVAALQSATTSSAPILLESSATSGHGIGDPLDATIARDTDILAFLMEELSMHLPQPKK